METPRTFGSDNFSTVHPDVMSYLAEINGRGHMQSYEGDPVTLEAEHLFKEAFGEGTQTIFVPSGTGANILSCCFKDLMKQLLRQLRHTYLKKRPERIFLPSHMRTAKLAPWPLRMMCLCVKN